MVNLTWKSGLAIAVVSVLLVAAYGATVYAGITDWVPPWAIPDDDIPTTIVPEDVEWSAFKYTAVRKDATATTVTGATTRVWFDADADGYMDIDEIGSFTEASAVYTSDMEYPIGLDFDLHVQVYASTYQVTYSVEHMSGQRNSDGSAKNVGQIELILTDDSVVYNGEICGVGWDDGTDYNATLSGDVGDAEIEVVLAAADYGLSSQIWEGFDYETAYGIERDLPFYVKWDEITEDGIAKSSVMAPDFLGFYLAIADKNYLKPSVSDFDYYGDDNTNWFGMKIVNPSWGDLFYNTADPSAPKPSITFSVGTISVTGTTPANAYGIIIYTGLTYAQMEAFEWTQSAARTLGTGGNDWDWTVN